MEQENDDLNNSSISLLEKSELDIELELCEEILAIDDSSENDVVFLYEVTPPNFKSECESEDEFDSEVKKCRDILKIEEISNPSNPCQDATECIQVSEEQIKYESDSENSEQNSQSSSESIEITSETNIVEKQQVDFNLTKSSHEVSNASHEELQSVSNTDISIQESEDLEVVSILQESNEETDFDSLDMVERISDEDALSLFAETDISTADDEGSVKDSLSAPQSPKPCIPERSNDEATVKKVSSVILVPPTSSIESESKDIYDPGWESIKSLQTNEQRYKQVKQCWNSSTVPDPYKNLTCHTYRKRHFRNSETVPRTRKRAATTNLEQSCLNPAKRQRSCTFKFDQNIDSLSNEKKQQEQELFQQMNNKVRELNNNFYRQKQQLQRRCYAYGGSNPHAYVELYSLRHKQQREIELVQRQYNDLANKCTSKLNDGIYQLSQARNEVLQFYSFYKGFNSKDPTVLTPSQEQELEEIENVYVQFDKLYK